MKILVTGGGGFIGVWVVRRLVEKGISVRIMELHEDRTLLQKVVGERHQTIEWLSGDIGLLTDVASAMTGCDGVVHLAGALGPMCESDPAVGARINLIGTLHVLSEAKARSARVVYASTALVHGEQGFGSVPQSHYGVFKLAAEYCAHIQYRREGISSVGLRPPVVFGFGRTMGNSAGPSIACEAAAAGRAYTIPFAGALDLIYVEDVAEAFVAAVLEHIEGAHAGDLPGTVMSPNQFVAAIKTLLPGARIDCAGPEHPINLKRPRDALDNLLPGLRCTPISQGIAATMRYHKDGVPSLT